MLTKRHTLLLGAGALISSSIGPLAQQQNSGAAAAIDAFRDALPFVFDPEARLAPAPDAIARFLDEEASAREALFGDLNDLSNEEVFASFIPDIIEQLGIQLPDVDLLVPLAAAVERLKGEGIAEVRPDDSVSQVVLDIVIETLGLEVFRPALVELAEGDSEFGRTYRELLERLEIRDFEGATDALINLVLFLMSGPGQTLLQRAVGNSMTRREVRNTLLRALGSRVVPVVGWAFTAAAFTACLFRHGQRLRAAFQAD